MADYFFDSSALVKRHVEEPGSKWVRSLIRASATYRIYIARITPVEVLAVITRRQHGGDLSAAQAGAMLSHFLRHLDQRYRIIDLTPAIFADAMLKARKRRLRAYDAVQLAAALELRRQHHAAGLAPVTLISADQALNDAAIAEGLTVDDPRSHP
ncbi:MAG: type II toxin-antitoxin system VapC family toxin [Isosphaeraceae bacterium]